MSKKNTKPESKSTKTEARAERDAASASPGAHSLEYRLESACGLAESAEEKLSRLVAAFVYLSGEAREHGTDVSLEDFHEDAAGVRSALRCIHDELQCCKGPDEDDEDDGARSHLQRRRSALETCITFHPHGTWTDATLAVARSQAPTLDLAPKAWVARLDELESAIREVRENDPAGGASVMS